MKKSLLAVGAAFMMLAGFVTGCATHGEVAEKYQKFQEAVAARPPAYVPTGEKALDDAAILSAQIYAELIKYLDEYVKATENHRYYIGFINDSTELAKEKKIPMGEAMAQMLEEYRQADAGKAPEEMVYPRVVEGYNAVLALKPENKIKELLPIAAQATKVAAQGKELADTIKKTYSSLPKNFNEAEQKTRVTLSLAKVLEQMYFDTQAANFLIDQYKRNLEMKKYMQK